MPSRRWGRSLGINNVPHKNCTYSCVYCQLGTADRTRTRPRRFHAAHEVVTAVTKRVAECRRTAQDIDYLTFVPDGEPTLDASLGTEIRRLKTLGLPIAVVTNGSLLSHETIRAALAPADVVSVKVDVVDRATWRRIHRPARALRLAAILEGIQTFAAGFDGELWTETMLVDGFNDRLRDLEHVAAFLETLRPSRAYLAVPTRPPALSIVHPPPEGVVSRAREALAGRLPRVELLVAHEEGDFGAGADPVEDLLGILAVHPMPEAEAVKYLQDAGEQAERVLAGLEEEGRMIRTRYLGRRFMARPLGHGRV